MRNGSLAGAHVQTHPNFRGFRLRNSSARQGVRREGRNELPNMPPRTGLGRFLVRGFYKDVAPTALGRRTGTKRTDLAAVIDRRYRAGAFFGSGVLQ